MKEIKRLIQKSYNVLKSGGVLELGKEAGHYTKSIVRKIGGGFLFREKNSADILFITCSPDGISYAPSRYRVFFQKEQLESQGASVDVMYYADVKEDDIDRYDVFIFHRVPFLEELEMCAKKIKKQNKMIIYDIDDLIFEKELIEGKHEVDEMSEIDKRKYFDGVERNLKMLQLCEYGIASTEIIATHMRKYIDNIFVQRNGFSKELLQISKEESNKKLDKKKDIVLGYFGGSATHNDDLNLIAEPLSLILKKYDNVQLFIVGPVVLPKKLQQFSNNISYQKFVSWKKLPEMIASVNINLAPLTNTLFNNAKSEIKYTEAALVSVPTVASKSNSFMHAIRHAKTGFVAENNEEWFKYIEQLICDEQLRQRIGGNAFVDVTNEYNVTQKGRALMNFLEDNRAKKIAYIVPTTNISGGVMVVAQHVKMLQSIGYNTLLISCGRSKELNWIDNFSVPIIKYETFLTNKQNKFLDIAIATLWSTLEYVMNSKAKQKFYFVQNREYDFYKKDNPLYEKAKDTYRNNDVNFFTMSLWCQDWLLDIFGRSAQYVPNGIDINIFNIKGDVIAEKIKDKTRILIEGNPDDHYKNVDESFRIIDKLDKDKYEVWLISYGGRPKQWYKYDRFFQGVSYADMPKYFRSCDIFLKTSKLESFSYPPLEMMACGGVCVIAENEGNKAYARNEYNVLSYQVGKIDVAVNNINRLVNDQSLRQIIISNGIKTVQEWSWDKSINELEKILLNK